MRQNMLLIACLASVEAVAVGGGSSLGRKVVNDGIYAYRVTNMSESVQFNPSTDGRAQLLRGELDFCLTEAAFSAAEFATYPDLMMVPIFTGAIVPIINIPELQNNSLILTKTTLSQIFLGNIRYWDDPNITEYNPDLPHEKIQLIVRAESSGTTFVFTSTLSSIDQEFESRIGRSELPNWKPVAGGPCLAILNMTLCNQTSGCSWELNSTNTSGCMPEFPRVMAEEKNLGVTGLVAVTQYSIGYAVLADAQAQGLSTVSFQTQPGTVVSAGVTSLTFTILENGANPQATDGTVVKIHDPTNPFAWPIAGYTYLGVRTNTTRTGGDCRARGQTVNFWLWFLSSGVMRDLAALSGFVTTPDVIRRTNQLSEQIGSIRCDNGMLAIPPPSTSAYACSGLSSGSMLSMFMLYLRLWNSENPSNPAVWTYSAENGAASLMALMQYQRGFSAVIPTQLPNPLRANATAAGIRFIPLFFVASVPVFMFPAGSPLGQLMFDWDTLGNVFTGKISAWNDTALQRLNPTLSLPSGVIDVVVSVDTETASVFAQSLYENSQTFQAAVRAGLALAGLQEVQYPFNWSWGFPSLLTPSNFHVVPERNKGSQLLLLKNTGYISFRVVGEDSITDAAGIIQKGVPMTFNSSVLQACATHALTAVSIDASVTDGSWTLSADGDCWPFVHLATVAVFSRFESKNNVVQLQTSGLCDSQPSLELLRWLLTNERLSSTSALGLAWLTPSSRAVFVDQIERFTCDGQTILREFPVVWELPLGMFVFIILASTIGIIVTIVSAVMMFRFRRKLTFKKSGPLFMSLVLVGAGCMYLCVIFLALTPTRASCGLFYWLFNLGFTFIFGPLFLKNLRIYRIFLSSQFAVKTLSNRKMFAYFFLLLCVHVVLLGLNQGLDPLGPVTSMSVFPFQKFTQCNTASFLSWTLNLDIVYVATLLLCNAALCFGIRHVDRSFNESKKIGFVVYNNLLCYGIALLLLLTVDMRGNAVVVMFALGIYWTSSFVVVTHFLVKARKVIQHRGNQGRDIEAHKTNLTLASNAPMRISENTGGVVGDVPTRGRVPTDPVPSS